MSLLPKNKNAIATAHLKRLVTFPDSVSVTEVNITKPKQNMKVGISLKNMPREGGIGISGLNDTSPLLGTAIRPRGGQVLLAINGNSELPDISSAASILGSRQKLALLVCEQHAHYNTPQSCLQIVAAPFYPYHPGINFTSTRGRTMVCVSKIFASGPFAGNKYVHKGDIVLAVNGIPVSKPEDADKALRMPHSNGTVTVLHLVDMQQFRALCLAAIIENSHRSIPKDVKMEFPQQDTTTHDNHTLMIVKRANKPDKYVRLQYNMETQHMEDLEPYTKLLAELNHDTIAARDGMHNPKACFKKWYQQGASKFIDLFNDLVEYNLDPLEDAICEHAWRHSPDNRSVSMRSHSMRSISRPSINSRPTSPTIRRTSSHSRPTSPTSVNNLAPIPTVVVAAETTEAPVYLSPQQQQLSLSEDGAEPDFIAC